MEKKIIDIILQKKISYEFVQGKIKRRKEKTRYQNKITRETKLREKILT